MSNPLVKLTVSHLRGATIPFALEFEAHKSLTLIYGENGTGKSTICDALEILGGRYTSLDARGLGPKTGRYWPSVGKRPDDLAVSLEMRSGTITATLKKGEIVVDPAPSQFRVEILRRRQLFRLIEARPAERYDAIRRFVDVTGIEASEGKQRDLLATLKEEQKTAVVQAGENDAFIREVWAKSGTDIEDALTWARSTSEADVAANEDEELALARLSSLYLSLGTFPERIRQLQASYEAASHKADTAAAHARDLVGKEATAGETIVVLRAVAAYLDVHPASSVCPACESTEKASGLRGRIAERLTGLAKIDSATQAENVSVEDARRSRANLEEITAQLKAAIESFNSFRKSRVWSASVLLPKSEPPVDIDLLKEWLGETEHLPSSWNNVAAGQEDRRHFMQALRTAVSMFDQNTKRMNDLDALIPKIERAHEIVKEERREFTDSILRDIAAEVGRLYEMVHPGEGLSKISLALDPNRRSSLDIDAEFLGSDCPPQAYFSDSHLDTLGLCLFLAITAREDRDSVLLILDDVLASADEPHVERLIQMIYEETLKFRHCILTTHYKPWREKLRWGWLRHGSCQLVELGAWSAANGISTIKMLPEVERLRALLGQSPPDIQAICAKAGVVLEAAVDFMTQLYECAVPRRLGGRYTLGELLPAIDKKLRKALNVEVLTSPGTSGNSPTYTKIALGPILDEVSRIAQVRNVLGCHFNELTFELLDSDGTQFGNSVVALVDALVDKDVGWPRNDKSGSYWATTGETRRLHPLRQPK